MVPKLTKKQQNKQIKKETIVCVIAYLGYFVWWLATGYGIGRKDPSQYPYIMGLPLWFFLSVIVGAILFCVTAVIVIKVFFKDFDLEETLPEDTVNEK
jgi:uncharacterized membrane protein YhdT